MGAIGEKIMATRKQASRTKPVIKDGSLKKNSKPSQTATAAKTSPA